MQAIFEVKDKLREWKPPFKIEEATHTYTVQEKDTFCPFIEGEDTFQLLEISGNKARIRFDRTYVLKNYEQPMNKEIWFNMGQSVEFSQAWASHGRTKTLTLKGIESAKTAASDDE